MKKLIALAVALVATGAQTVSADPLMKYTYFDAAYQWTKDVEDGGNGANGVDSKISYAVIDNLAIEGGYNFLNVSNLDVNQNIYKYGIAGWHSFCEGIDVVGRVGGAHRALNSEFGDSDGDGVYVGGSLRSLLTDSIEGNFDVTYQNIDGINEWVYGLTGLAAITEEVALKAGVTMTDDSILSLVGGLRVTM